MVEGIAGGYGHFWYMVGELYHKASKYRYTQICGWLYGALVAAALVVCSDDIEPINQHETYMHAFIDRILPENAHLKANKGLAIIMCDRSLRSRTITHWTSRAALIDCLLASMHLPFVHTPDHIYKSIDGRFARDLHIHYTDDQHRIRAPVRRLFTNISLTAKGLFKNGLEDSMFGRKYEPDDDLRFYIFCIIISVIYKWT